MTTAAKGTAARARAREVDEQVVKIAKLMVDGLWEPGVTAHQIAEMEGVQPATVDEWASDAGRLLRVGPDVELYRSINLRRLDQTFAMSSDAKARVAAVAEQNKMLGLHAAMKVDVTVQAFAQLPPPAMLVKVREQIAELQRLEQQLAAQVEAVLVLPEGDE
jgi:hypothetical protein